MAWTPVKTWNTGDTLPAADLNTYVRDNLTFLHDRGADLASAATVTPTTQFHKVTGTTTVDNIAAPTDGHTVALWFQSALTVRNNGAGTGNIRTAGGADKPVPADTIVLFRSDGTVWKEIAPGTAAGLALTADSLLGSAAATIDFQGIAGGFHLRATLYGRSDIVATSDDLGVRFNNDSGANYDSVSTKSTGSAATTAGTNGATSIALVGAITGSTAVANSFAMADLVVAQYAGATGEKEAELYAAAKVSNVATGFSVWAASGYWRSTSAINRITLYAAGGNLIAGTRASIYVF